jgi:hypothetical protein
MKTTTNEVRLWIDSLTNLLEHSSTWININPAVGKSGEFHRR